MQKLNPTSTNLKKFSLQMFIVLAVIGSVQLLRHERSYFLFYLGGVIFLLGVWIHPFVKPLYFIFRKLTFIIEWLSTKIIMCFIFYLVLTPLGLAMRLWGKDPLDRKIEKGKLSYWKEKDRQAFNVLDYERQF